MDTVFLQKSPAVLRPRGAVLGGVPTHNHVQVVSNKKEITTIVGERRLALPPSITANDWLYDGRKAYVMILLLGSGFGGSNSL